MHPTTTAPEETPESADQRSPVESPISEPPAGDLPPDIARPAVDPAGPAEPIVARGSNDYRVRRYLMVALVFGFGLYFLYDGFVGWPGLNARIAETQAAHDAAQTAGHETERVRLAGELSALGNPKTGSDIWLQKFLGFTLPPAALAYLAWTLYNSRGVYRLHGRTLEVPGHGSISLDDVVTVHRDRWDRKGIATVAYRTGDGGTRSFKLDDFVYQRPPTDAIYDYIDAAERSGRSPVVAEGRHGSSGLGA